MGQLSHLFGYEISADLVQQQKLVIAAPIVQSKSADLSLSCCTTPS